MVIMSSSKPSGSAPPKCIDPFDFFTVNESINSALDIIKRAASSLQVTTLKATARYEVRVLLEDESLPLKYLVWAICWYEPQQHHITLLSQQSIYPQTEATSRTASSNHLASLHLQGNNFCPSWYAYLLLQTSTQNAHPAPNHGCILDTATQAFCHHLHYWL